jgi:hypothetical protein
MVRLLLALAALSVCACSSSSGSAGPSASTNPTPLAAAQEFGAAFCQRIGACFGGDAGVNVNTCTATFTSTVPATGNDACTQAQIDSCTSDVQKLDCGSLATALLSDGGAALYMALPSSCNGC